MTKQEVYTKILAIVPDSKRAEELTKYLCINIVTDIKNVIEIEIKLNYNCNAIYNGQWVTVASSLDVDYIIKGNYKYQLTLNI